MENSVQKKSRILYYDMLNICACLCVVFLHSNGLAHTYSPTLGWLQAFFIEVVCYWAVPVFFMLSGATLMNYRKKYDTKCFLKKRFLRTVIPFFIWSFIILIWKHATGQLDIFSFTAREIFEKFSLTSIENIYWFFIPLFSIYLCIPLLSHLTEEKHRPTLWYAVALAFFIQSLFPLIFKICGLAFNTAFSVPVLGNYLIYVVLGYLLSTEDFSKGKRIIIYCLGIFGAAFRFFGTVYLSAKDGSLNKTFFDYKGFYAIFLSAAVFVLFKYFPWSKIFKTEKSARAISKISSCSFGIYLIHISVMFVFKTYLHIPAVGPVWRLLMPFVTYTVCLGAVLAIKKIPILRNIFP